MLISKYGLNYVVYSAGIGMEASNMWDMCFLDAREWWIGFNS